MRYQSENADVKFLLRSVDEAQYFACSLKKSIILCDVLDCVVVHMLFVEFFVSIFFLIGQAISGRVTPSSRPVWRCDSHQSHFK